MSMINMMRLYSVSALMTDICADKLKEVLVIEYLSGDRYVGELQGGNRHGIGMFVYKCTGEKVIGRWNNNFM
jgi:hypothetical protein